jgi:predicted RNase H-like nuclease (RuvC/YqgF family)
LSNFFFKSCRKVVKNNQKVAKSCPESSQKVVKKLSKSCKKLQKIAKKLSKKLSKMNKKLSEQLSKILKRVRWRRRRRRRRRRIFVAPRPGTTLSHLVKMLLRKLVFTNYCLAIGQAGDFLTQMSKRFLKLCLSLVNVPQEP